MGMKAIGQGLKTRLQTIQDFAIVFAPDEIPDTIPTLPCAIILPGNTEYDITFPNDSDTGEVNCVFRVIILVAKPDLPSALSRILDYADATGDSSVRAAIYGDCTLGASCDDCQVKTNTGAGYTMWGGIQYLSTQFEVICYG